MNNRVKLNQQKCKTIIITTSTTSIVRSILKYCISVLYYIFTNTTYISQQTSELFNLKARGAQYKHLY